MLRGYEDLTDSEGDPAVTAAAEGALVAAEVLDKKRKRALRAARMSLWQTTARELFEQEADDVKAEMVRLTQEENIKRGLGAPPDTEDAMSPKALQL
jgi:hypothetical protein